jgi:hypothetical protein
LKGVFTFTTKKIRLRLCASHKIFLHILWLTIASVRFTILAEKNEVGKRQKKACTRIKISYSIIDSSSIINIDLTSYTELAFWWKIPSFFYRIFIATFLVSLPIFISGKVIWRIAVTESGNNLLRMATQINIFFSLSLLLLTVNYTSGLEVSSFPRLISRPSQIHLRFAFYIHQQVSFLCWWNDVKKIQMNFIDQKKWKE